MLIIVFFILFEEHWYTTRIEGNKPMGIILLSISKKIKWNKYNYFYRKYNCASSELLSTYLGIIIGNFVIQTIVNLTIQNVIILFK